jgi:hypothetical protein
MDMDIETYDHSIFSMSTELENVWHGIDKYDMQQLLPDAGAPNNTLVGTGNCSGTTTFSWNDSGNEWYSPVNSYFYFKFRFVYYSSPGVFAPIPILDSAGNMNLYPSNLVCYADNFVSTLFSTIMTYINQNPVDTITQPWVIDQILTYSNGKKNFLDTFGSLARVGETLNQRLINTWGNGNATGGVVEVCYRPPCSIFDVNLLPPGGYHKIDFTWNTNPISAFESLIGSISVGTGTGQYNIFCDTFYFYKATCRPSPQIPLPMHGVIPLCGSNVKQYPITSTTSFQQNITLAPTTNRIYVAFQDINQNPSVTTQAVTSPTTTTSPFIDTTGIKYMGYGTGWTPQTSFTKSFSAPNPNQAGTSLLYELKTFFIQISDLSLILPHPPYNFGTDGTDYLRAYMDWANCVGTKYNDNGSVPFGYAFNSALTATNTFKALNSTGITLAYGSNFTTSSNVTPATLLRNGNPLNPQELTLLTSVDDTAVSNQVFSSGTNGRSLYFQTSEYGWLARHPGPIFAYNVTRPSGSKVSQGNMQVSFTGTISSALANVVCTFNNALAVVRNEQGKYDYQLVSGQ